MCFVFSMTELQTNQIRTVLFAYIQLYMLTYTVYKLKFFKATNKHWE